MPFTPASTLFLCY